MVTQIRLELAAQRPLTSADGYPLYRALVDQTGTKYRDLLRRPGLKPVRQFVLPGAEENGGVQLIHLLNQEAHNHLLPLLLRLSAYHLPGEAEPVEVLSVSVRRIDESELVSRFFTGPAPQTGVGLVLLTPTAYRAGGEYAVFPSAEWIVRDAAARFNNLGLALKLDPQTVERIASAARIDGYRIASAHYPLGRHSVPGFVGKLVLSAELPEQTARLFHMLLHALRFTGAGAKPSLGMGAVELKEV